MGPRRCYNKNAELTDNEQVEPIQPWWWQIKHLISPRTLGKMNPCWLIFFQMGWFNHPAGFIRGYVLLRDPFILVQRLNIVYSNCHKAYNNGPAKWGKMGGSIRIISLCHRFFWEVNFAAMISLPPKKSVTCTQQKSSNFKSFARWWQLKHFICSPLSPWGNDPIWLAHIFQMGWNSTTN